MNESDMERALHYLKLKSDEYASARAQAEYLKEFRKSKKALLINEAEIKGRKTQQERESYAYSHDEYIEVLEGIKVAQEVAEKLRLMVKAAELQIDIWKTNQMKIMAEMKLR